MCDAVVPLSVRRSRAIEFSIVSRASSRENHRAVGVVKNSARTRRVSVTFRRPVLPFPIPLPIPLPPLSRPFPPRYSSCGATSLRRVRVYATGGNLLCDRVAIFPCVPVVNLHHISGDGILAFLDIHHRHRCPGKLRQSCPPKGAGTPSELEEEKEEKGEEKPRHHRREGSRGRPTADTRNRGWRTKAKCERASFLYSLCAL